LKDPSKSQDLQLGFIAQELEKALPNLVHTDEAGYKSVNYIGLIPLLTEAIKEQQKTLEKQAASIEKLQGELAEIKALLEEK